MRSAFTLIELLVVVAILAVLSGMLLGTVKIVRESAQGSRCLGNIRQFSMSALAYATDQRYLPPIKSNFNGVQLHWFNHVAAYQDGSGKAETNQATATRLVRDCPTYRARAPAMVQIDGGNAATSPGIGYNGKLKADYSIDANTNPAIVSLNTRHGDWTGSWGISTRSWFSLASITYHSRRALFGDGVDWSLNGSGAIANTSGNTAPAPNYGFARIVPGGSAKWQALVDAGFFWGNGDPTRHRQRMNIGFVDGHAKSVRPEWAVFTLENPVKFQGE